MEPDAFERQVSGIAALDHPLSLRAYRMATGPGWVSRDDVADALQVARSVAAFHLDKLVDAGLLETRFQRTSGRSGPGAGRPAKLYRRGVQETGVSLPPRRYDIAGSLLAAAVEHATAHSTPVSRSLATVARQAGREAGRLESGREKPGGLVAALDRHGYEPDACDVDVVLRNCPFHRLAQEHRGLVCAMNLDFLTGLVDGLGQARTVTARLAPEPGRCCVRLGTGDATRTHRVAP